MSPKKPTTGAPAPQLTAAVAGDTVTVRPVLKRDPRAPSYFTPVVDIRVTDRDIRLLSFVVPAADADELEAVDGGFILPIRSQCELILPPETVEVLIQGLQQQLAALREAQAAE